MEISTGQIASQLPNSPLLSLAAVYGGGLCTVTDPRFYSYRREPVTGRFASLIWLAGDESA